MKIGELISEVNKIEKLIEQEQEPKNPFLNKIPKSGIKVNKDVILIYPLV